MQRLFLTMSLGWMGFFPPATRGENPVVIMETSKGVIKIELFADQAPLTVKNFLQYVDEKHYDGTIFHRVIDGFMIQGGGYTPGMNEKKTRPPIKNESGNGLSNRRGTIAMARTSDPDSATAQFFINVVDNPNLDRREGSAGYCVFGRVVEGMDVVDKIRSVPTRDVKRAGRVLWESVPVDDIVIHTVQRRMK